MKYIIAFICILIVVIRNLIPSIIFDNNSLILLIVAFIILIIPDTKEIFGRLKKIKKGDIELEFESKLNKLNAATERAEKLLDKPGLKLQRSTGISPVVSRKIAQASLDPRASLLILAIEIEQAARALVEESKIPESKRFYSVPRMLEVLVSEKKLPKDVVASFRDFWSIRNQVVHGIHFELSERQLYELVEIGVRILKLLTSRISFEYIECPKCGSQAKVTAVTSHWVEADCPKCGHVIVD